MLYSDVQGWLERFESEVCGKRKRIRGRVFSGVRLEMYVDGGIVVVLNPTSEGGDEESRVLSFVKDVFDPRVLEAFIARDRWEKIVAGSDEIREEDWMWDDEQ